MAVTAVALLASTALTASAHPPTDTLHGGTGGGVKVVGHTDIGDLNGHVAVLGNYAYVGVGTNGGFASQWNKTPKCSDPGDTTLPLPTVKVVSLVNPASPTVVSTISVGVPGAERATIARDVAALHVDAGLASYDLLAVALESCNRDEGLVGVNFYNVSNPAMPILLSHDSRFAGNVSTRSVSLVQRADGRVFAIESNQGGLSGAINVVDVTVPTAPVTVGTFPPQGPSVSSPPLECRPFSFAQGANPNGAGTKAYGAYGDDGLFVIDISDPNPAIDLAGSQTKYGPTEEGNSFRFVPSADESRAVATDEDLQPARTTLTVSAGSASTVTEPGQTVPGVFRGCEAIWGAPLFKRSTPSITSTVVFIPAGGCQADFYAGKDVAGKIVLVDRGGSTSTGGVCGFETKAKFAQDPNQDADLSDGAAAVLVANTGQDHHGQGTNYLFSVDSVSPVDAGVTIPLVNMTLEARTALKDAIDGGETVTATLADNADTWGALRIFSLSGASPTQTAVFNAPHTNVLTPGDGLYHAVNAVWSGNQALVAWMSDGLRVVDVTNPSAPVGRAHYVPPAAVDGTGQYGTVPLVVGVARHGSRVVISDINGGLYVLNVVMRESDCVNGGWANYGFPNQGQCKKLFV